MRSCSERSAHSVCTMLMSSDAAARWERKSSATSLMSTARMCTFRPMSDLDNNNNPANEIARLPAPHPASIIVRPLDEEEEG